MTDKMLNLGKMRVTATYTGSTASMFTFGYRAFVLFAGDNLETSIFRHMLFVNLQPESTTFTVR